MAVAPALDFTAPRTAVGASYVGVYADAAGTQPCASVPPSTAKTLYVVAKLDGVASGGLTGAEFRIEFGSATGWFASYAAPTTANTALGNPIDTDPDPNAGGGLTLAFPSCQVPVNGMVGLGTLSVFNVSGSTTRLQVKRHSAPSNTNYACPLFVVCNDPVFSMLCMSAGEAAPCSTLGVPKSHAAPANDPVVFELGLNITPVSVPAESPFTESLTVGNGNELWVMGQLVPGPAVEVAFDGTQIMINGIAVYQIPAPAISEEGLQQRYAKIPRVIDCMTAGMTLREAYTVYRSEVNALVDQGCLAYNLGGDALLRQVVESSPLIATVAEVRNGRVQIIYRGREHLSTVGFGCNPADQPRLPSKREGAERLTAMLRITLQRTVPSLVLVSGNGVADFTGEQAAEVRAQLEHVQRTGSTDGLPPGPLPKTSSEFRAIQLSRTRGGK